MLSTHMSCLKAKADDINSWLEQSRAQYAEVISAAQQNLTKIEQIQSSREETAKTIASRLNGDASGSEGLRKVRERSGNTSPASFLMPSMSIKKAAQIIEKQRAFMTQLRISETSRIVDDVSKTKSGARTSPAEASKTSFALGL